MTNPHKQSWQLVDFETLSKSAVHKVQVFKEADKKPQWAYIAIYTYVCVHSTLCTLLLCLDNHYS